MLKELQKQLQSYVVEAITETNFPLAMAVYEANQGFFRLTEGKETTMEESRRDIHALPPGLHSEDKLYAGVCGKRDKWWRC